MRYLPLLLLVALVPGVALADDHQNVILVPCGNTEVPDTAPIPSDCFGWYYTPRQGQPEDLASTQPHWTIAQTYTPTVTESLLSVDVYGQCGGNDLSGDCDAQDTLSIQFYTLGANGYPGPLVASQMVPVNLWPDTVCGSFDSCGATRRITFYDPATLQQGQTYVLALSSAFEGEFILGNTIDVVVGKPDIGNDPIAASVNYTDPPNMAATPELDSLWLFATGLSGIAGYALLRRRAK